MSKVLVSFLFILNAYSMENFMEFGNINFGRDFKDKSKWLMKAGVEYINYTSTFPEYSGEHQKYTESETDELNGYGFSLGRDFYLGNGFSSLVSMNLMYAKTLDKIVGKAAEDIDFDYSSARDSHEFVSAEASIALNYIYDFKVVDIQPFIEFGFGLGQNEINKEYSTLGFTGDSDSSEDYDVTVLEEFAMTRVSLGVNFISYKGLMSYFKASAISVAKTGRNTNGESNLRDSTIIVKYDSDESNLSDSETITTLSMGIGSFF